MSTMIRNGYRLAAGTNPFEFSRRVRDIMDPLRVLADGALLGRLATAEADRHWHDQEKVKSILAYSVFNAWEEKQKALPEESHAKDPHLFEMCLGEDTETGRILVRPYTKLQTMADAFEAMPAWRPTATGATGMHRQASPSSKGSSAVWHGSGCCPTTHRRSRRC